MTKVVIKVAHSAVYTKDATCTWRLSSGSLGESAWSPGLEQGGFGNWNWMDHYGTVLLPYIAYTFVNLCQLRRSNIVQLTRAVNCAHHDRSSGNRQPPAAAHDNADRSAKVRGQGMLSS